MAQARYRHPLLALIVLLLCLAPLGARAALVHAPRWQELTPAQKQFLGPLQSEWNALEPARRLKWVGIAQRYPSMTPDEQGRISARLQAWVKLTPDQRRKAREEYKRLRKLPSDQRPALAQKWEEYLALPPDEKERLRTPAAPANKPADARCKRVPPAWLVPPWLRPAPSLRPPKP